MSAASLDPRIQAIRASIHGAGADRDQRGADLDEHAPGDAESAGLQAAVSLVLRAGDQLDFLLVKRATHERDPWSGQMALPGGRWELDDDGLLYTAQRETREETGVDLVSVGTPIGRLNDVTTASPRIPKLRIAAFAFAVPRETEATVASPELDSVHWVPIDLLRAPETASEVKIDYPGHRRRFPSYNVVGEHVWGLTHRILSGFLDLYE